MGYALSWLAVRDSEPAVLAHLGLVATDRQGDYPDTPLVGRMLDNGWYLVVASTCDHRILQPDLLAGVSTASPLLACSIEEHVMVARAEYWHQGTRRWRIEHDSQQGSAHLSAEGDVPAELTEIIATCAELQAQEAGVDYYFEIPLVAARQVMGFKHDESDFGPLAWTVLTDPMGNKRPWWRPW